MKHMNATSSDLKSTVDLFAKLFESVYTSTIDSISITPSDLLKAIKELDVTKAAGPDEVPNLVLKSLAEVLVEPLGM